MFTVMGVKSNLIQDRNDDRVIVKEKIEYIFLLLSPEVEFQAFRLHLSFMASTLLIYKAQMI